METFRVLIVDDHMLVRNGLKQVFAEEYRRVVFGEAGTADEALAQIAKQPWDLVSMEITIPGRDGFYLLQQILLRRPGTRVLVLSSLEDPLSASRALKMGASDYVCKSAGRSELVKAIKHALNGKAHAARSFAPKSPAPVSSRRVVLSAREQNVMLAFAAGKGTAEIAAELSLSVTTVSTYKRRILNKLHLKSSANLIRYAIDHRLS
jgi:two-component system, NarL family, invasion response regulator UvrY